MAKPGAQQGANAGNLVQNEALGSGPRGASRNSYSASNMLKLLEAGGAARKQWACVISKLYGIGTNTHSVWDHSLKQVSKTASLSGGGLQKLLSFAVQRPWWALALQALTPNLCRKWATGACESLAEAAKAKTGDCYHVRGGKTCVGKRGHFQIGPARCSLMKLSDSEERHWRRGTRIHSRPCWDSW